MSDGLGFLVEEIKRSRHITSAIILGGKVACYFRLLPLSYITDGALLIQNIYLKVKNLGIHKKQEGKRY